MMSSIIVFSGSCRVSATRPYKARWPPKRGGGLRYVRSSARRPRSKFSTTYPDTTWHLLHVTKAKSEAEVDPRCLPADIGQELWRANEIEILQTSGEIADSGNVAPASAFAGRAGSLARGLCPV